MAARRPKRNGREVKSKRKHENSSMGTLCSLASMLAACWFAVVASCRTLALSMHTCIQFLYAKESHGGRAATPESRGVALSIVRAPVSVFYDQSTLRLLHNSLYFRVSRDVFGGSLFSCTWTRRFHRDSTCNLFLYLYLAFVRALPCFTVTSVWIACDRFSDFFRPSSVQIESLP